MQFATADCTSPTACQATQESGGQEVHVWSARQSAHSHTAIRFLSGYATSSLQVGGFCVQFFTIVNTILFAML